MISTPESARLHFSLDRENVCTEEKTRLCFEAAVLRNAHWVTAQERMGRNRRIREAEDRHDERSGR
jgi:hypothetical protein